jgi:hypothetical protein
LFVYLVTARHTIEKIRGLRDVSSVYVRINVSRSNESVWSEIPIDAFLGHPRDDEGIGATWLVKTSQLRYDVAVAFFPLDQLPDVAIHVWPLSGHVTSELLSGPTRVSTGDEVYVTGLYRNHVGENRNIPIVRSGIISAMPESPVMTSLGPSNVFLIESHSTGGLSGSPVFWTTGKFRLNYNDKTVEEQITVRILLLGVIHGHFEIEDSRPERTPWGVERSNEGMAMATPVSEILEVIRSEKMESNRNMYLKR